MAENKNANPAAEPLAKSAQAAHQIRGAIKTGKAIAGAAKGAAAGGPYGAIAGFAWENRKLIGKIIAVASSARRNVSAINDCINQAHSDVLERINDDIASQPEGTSSRVADNFAGSVIMDTNMLISQYCASKDKWNEINVNDLKKIINDHRGELFTYTVTTSTETSGETSVTVYTYTVQYVGNEKFKEIFGLDKKKTELAYSYAENLTTFLYGSSLIGGTAAVSADVERYSDKIQKYAEQYFQL